MDDTDIAMAGAFGLGLIVCFVLVIAHEVRKRFRKNRRRGLPPPSDACKRNSTQAVP